MLLTFGSSSAPPSTGSPSGHATTPEVSWPRGRSPDQAARECSQVSGPMAKPGRRQAMHLTMGSAYGSTWPSTRERAPAMPPTLRLGDRLARGEALLGLQQPTHHHQLAHQVVQGLAGGLPVRIGDRPDQQRVGLTMLLRGHPPRVRHPRPLAKLPYAPLTDHPKGHR